MSVTNQQWLTTMNKLSDQHDDIAFLLSGKRVAYIDIPLHYNVGDLLIYLGTEEFFKKNNINVVYRSEVNKTSLSALKKADAIVFHGGGNFGDLYTIHQKLREVVTSKFCDKLIICLPQTIHFSSDENLEKSAEIFSKHLNFHFFARDMKSFELARKFTDKIKLMPDMAHSLHPLVDISEVGPSNTAPRKILSLIRRDIESVSNNTSRSINKHGFDWSDIITLNEVVILRLYQLLRIVKPELALNLWYKNTRDIVFKSSQFFNQHDVVYTDRLHGLILASLLGKPVMLYDNSYGKNFSYYDCWLKDNPFITKC
ncbi:polysaccharide pyruvyl transferase family protein [Plesiomonas shigelloides]|uniref:polysaccharide pyruvyl transferase family protein n=1 Tax=Plesiomonas shigelloides TaxID=703 RepID=UPI002247F811|nr:polysaccharide pyruvyl transferase family protein [Plesiomonas shigelloides]MCX2534399.1 polysaccharide pyruvyl transferase family protein [Plesiomonas shigelloides]